MAGEAHLSRRGLFTKLLAALGAGAAASLVGAQRVLGGVDDGADMFVGFQYNDVETTTGLGNFRNTAPVFKASTTNGTAIEATSTAITGTAIQATSGQGSALNATAGFGRAVTAMSNGENPTVYVNNQGAGPSVLASHGLSNGQAIYALVQYSSPSEAIYAEAGAGPALRGVSQSGSAIVGQASSASSGYGGQFGGGKAQLRLVPRSTGGKPTTGSHSKGEIYLDKNGAVFICTAGGTPGTWRKVTTTTT